MGLTFIDADCCCGGPSGCGCCIETDTNFHLRLLVVIDGVKDWVPPPASGNFCSDCDDWNVEWPVSWTFFSDGFVDGEGACEWFNDVGTYPCEGTDIGFEMLCTVDNLFAQVGVWETFEPNPSGYGFIGDFTYDEAAPPIAIHCTGTTLDQIDFGSMDLAGGPFGDGGNRSLCDWSEATMYINFII